MPPPRTEDDPLCTFCWIAVAILTVFTTAGHIIAQVPEGYVGVVYYQGALQPSTLPPGWHSTWPFLTTTKLVETRQNVDEFKNIECSSTSGVTGYSNVRVTVEVSSANVLEAVELVGPQGIEDVWEREGARSCVNEVCSVMSVEDIQGRKFPTMHQQVLTCMRRRMPRCARTGTACITVLEVNFDKPSCPSTIQEQNAKLAAAAIEVRIKDKESEQFKMEAKGRWLQAQGAQNASAIMDATRAQSIVSLANATAAAARIEGDATVAVLRRLNDLLGPQAAAQTLALEHYFKAMGQLAASNNTKVVLDVGASGLVKHAINAAEAAWNS